MFERPIDQNAGGILRVIQDLQRPRPASVLSRPDWIADRWADMSP